jgi:hypothetical protein
MEQRTCCIAQRYNWGYTIDAQYTYSTTWNKRTPYKLSSDNYLCTLFALVFVLQRCTLCDAAHKMVSASVTEQRDTPLETERPAGICHDEHKTPEI